MMSARTPQEAAWRAVLELFLEARPRLLDAAARLGLNPPQAMALQRLEPGEPLPMGRLAEFLHCDASNVTGIADRLEAAGLAERRPGERDRRVKTLVLTEEGVRRRAEYLTAMRQPPASLAALSDEDAALLCELLGRPAPAATAADARA
jgi:DNA-binding MarR family transcriptional regulator